MIGERGFWAFALGLVLLLGGLTLAQPSGRELTSFQAPVGSASRERDGEDVAQVQGRSVQYAQVRTGARSTLRIAISGAHGGVLVSLVNASDRVREAQVEAAGRVAVFGSVARGSYSIRAVATPQEGSTSNGFITLRVSTGGRPWELFGAAALLLLLPPVVFSARKRINRRDEKPTNR